MYLKVHLTFKEIRTARAAAGASRRRRSYDIIVLIRNVVNDQKSYRKAVFLSIFNDL